MDETHEQYDVVVVGGGAAGLSGALTLARARMSRHHPDGRAVTLHDAVLRARRRR